MRPRFWAKIGGLFAVFLTLCWLWWSHLGRERLEEQIDLISSAHEPVYPGDLDFSAVPDYENAAHYYSLASAAISATASCPASSNLNYQNYPPYPAVWYQMADQAVAADPKALALARQARNFDRVDWGSRSPPGYRGSFTINYFNPARNLANLLGDSALDAHFHHDDAEAFQRIFDLMHLHDAVQRRGFLIGRLVGIGIEALATERIEILALNLQVKGPSKLAATVSREDVLKLIGLLLDDSRESENIHEMLVSERVASLDESMNVFSHTTVLRPMVQLASADFLHNYSVLLQAAAAPDWAQCQTIYSALPAAPTNVATPDPNPPRFSRIPGWFMGTLGRYLMTEYRMTNDRRAAAISLAANLYRLDHGHWPANLRALVGDYLPAVPEDPFCAGHQPMGYVIVKSPNGGERPLVYSEPSGGPTTSTPPNLPWIGWQTTRPENLRQWRDITDWWEAPTTLPSGPKAVDH